MKRFVNIFGLLIALIIAVSAFIKANHYPGSALLFIFSLGLLLPLYFLFTLIIRFKEKKPALGLIAPGIFAGIFVLGVLFSLMHWPGGLALTYIGFLVLVLVLLVMAIISIFVKPEDQKFSPAVLVFTIIAISLVYAGLSKNVSKGNLVSNFLAIDNETKLCSYVEGQNKMLFDQLDSLEKPKLAAFRKTATELANFIAECKNEVLSDANDREPYKSYAEIKHIDDPDIAGHILQTRNSLSTMKIMIDDLKNEIQSLQISQDQKMELFKMFDFRAVQNFSPEGDWTEAYFKNTTVISAASTLAALQAKVLICENSVYNELLK